MVSQAIWDLAFKFRVVTGDLNSQQLFLNSGSHEVKIRAPSWPSGMHVTAAIRVNPEEHLEISRQPIREDLKGHGGLSPFIDPVFP